MPGIDLTPILLPLVYAVFSILGTVVLSLAAIAVNKLGTKLSLQTRQIIMDNLQIAAEASIHAGMMAAQPTIKQLGLTNATTQDRVTGQALQYFVAKFGATAKSAGLDVNTTDGQAAIKEVLTRVLPRAAFIANDSPVIASPPVPVVVVPAPVIANASPSSPQRGGRP